MVWLVWLFGDSDCFTFSPFLSPLQIWLYWFSPFSWSTRAFAQNEFLSERYSERVPSGLTIGEVYLRQLEFSINPDYKWAVYGFLFAWMLLFFFVGLFALHKVRLELVTGTKVAGDRDTTVSWITQPEKVPATGNADHGPRIHEEEKVDALTDPVGTATLATSALVEYRAASATVPQNQHQNSLRRISQFDAVVDVSSRSELTFEPHTLLWQRIEYTIIDPITKQPRKLLDSLCGWAEPYRMTALLGASGSGKTTLLVRFANCFP